MQRDISREKQVFRKTEIGMRNNSAGKGLDGQLSSEGVSPAFSTCHYEWYHHRLSDLCPKTGRREGGYAGSQPLCSCVPLWRGASWNARDTGPQEPRIQYSRDDLPPFIQAIHHRESTERKGTRRG
ncbi:uncharacterized protein LOC143180683 [Calliopsis andreniformis]|uniref:uncharacterized protein LOC143180683 n=1 Tax=Calliopsis andreniformis TaxID=337506 RepID=UPI003FCC7900